MVSLEHVSCQLYVESAVSFLFTWALFVYCKALHCTSIVLECIVLCIVSPAAYTIALYYIAMFCVVSLSIGLHFTVMHCHRHRITIHSFVSYYILCFITLHEFVLLYITRHCMSLHCIFCTVFQFSFTIPSKYFNLCQCWDVTESAHKSFKF